MCSCRCPECGSEVPNRRSGGILRTALNLLLVYVVLVFGGGTLKQCSNPIAARTGALMQAVTFVEPTIEWAEARGHDGLAGGLRTLARGFPVERML